MRRLLLAVSTLYFTVCSADPAKPIVADVISLPPSPSSWKVTEDVTIPAINIYHTTKFHYHQLFGEFREGVQLTERHYAIKTNITIYF